MKFFFGHDEIYDTHDSSRSFKLLLSSWAIAAPPQRQGLGRRVHQTDCQKSLMGYLLIVRGAHDLETSAVLETGRTRKSAAVCALATLSKAIVGS